MFRRSYKLVAFPVGTIGALPGGQVAAALPGLPGSDINAKPTSLGTLSGLQALDLSELRCKFHVKTKIGKPAHADIHVYNAAPSTRNYLGATGTVGIDLSAGYLDDGTAHIFTGELRAAPTTMQGPNYVTYLQGSDKTMALQNARMQCVVSANSTVYSAVQSIVGALNAYATSNGFAQLGMGNAKSATLGVPTLWPRGGGLTGYCVNVLSDLCKSAGLIWTIDHGQLLLTPQATGSPGHGSVISLSASSGLVGSPGNDGKGRFEFECLMVPGVGLNRIVEIDSKFVSGQYRVTSAQWVGDTHGKDWTIRCKAVHVVS